MDSVQGSETWNTYLKEDLNFLKMHLIVHGVSLFPWKPLDVQMLQTW